VPTLDEYKKLVAEHLVGLTEEESELLCRFDTTMASIAMTEWLRKRNRQK
jgi:hypothetical protein